MCVLLIDRFFFFQAEDGIRDLVRSRGLGDVYKRQGTIIELQCEIAAGEGQPHGAARHLELEPTQGQLLSLIHI